MDHTELYNLIEAGESQTVDFKKTISDLRKIAKTLVAFANTRGGFILVGVTDDRQIAGIDPDEEQYMLQQAAEEYCQPAVNIEFTAIEDENEKTVLVAHIPESQQKPHYAFDLSGEWHAYVRMNDKSVLAAQSVIKSLKNHSDSREKPQDLEPAEQSLLTFLKTHERITLKGYAKLVNISERRAKRSLVALTRRGILFEHDLEKENYYSLA